MKRLMIAVSALALAFGLNAAMAPVGTSFEGVDAPVAFTAGTAVEKLAGGADWVIPDDDANQQLTVTAHDSAKTGAYRPKQYEEAGAANYLAVRTSFGKPVTLKSGAAAVEIPASGLYFDSEVKLTACDADPDITAYDGAKILVYALEDETTGATTLKAQCGYVAADGTVTPKTYDLGGVDCEAWHRLTIKAINTIASSEAYSIPGFVIYLDAIQPDGTDGIASDAERVAPGFPLSGAAKALGNKLFPAYVKDFEADNGKIAGVGFDGQGGVDDLVFTDDTPFDAAKAVAATVGDQSFETLQEAINYVNDEAAGDVTLRVVDASGFAGAAFENDAVTSLVIDLNGQTLKVAEGDVINSAIPLTIVDSDAEKQGRVVPGEEGFAVFATALTVQDGTFDGAVVATDPDTVFLLQGACRFLADAQDTLLEKAKCPEGMELVLKDEYYVLAYKPKTVIFIAEGQDDIEIKAPYGEPIPEELIPADPKAPKIWQKFGAWFDGDEPYDFGAEVTEDLTLKAKFVEGFTKDDAGNCLIADVDDLNKLAAYVDDGEDTAGKVFKQTADIDFAAVNTVAFPGIGTYADSSSVLTTKAFCGTYDGNGKTISNLKLASEKADGSAKQGTGLFNVLRNATVKDLTIDTVTYVPEISQAKQGGAMLAGNAIGSEIINVTTKGTNGSADHPVTYNAAGLVARIEASGEKSTRITGCTNEADIYCAYTKIAGICPIVNVFDPQNITYISKCVNKGKLVGVTSAIAGKTPGSDGIAGILAYGQQPSNAIVPDYYVEIEDCANDGEIVGVSGSVIGSLVGYLHLHVNFAGANTSTKFYPAVGKSDKLTLALGEAPYFAKVDAETMTGTFCKDVAANGIYAATIANANAIKFGEKIGDWLYITKNICAYTGEVTTEVADAKVEKTDFVDPTTGIESYKYEIVADAPAIPEVAPGGAPVKVEAASAEEAISKVTVKATSPDAAVIADEDYAKYFKPVAYDLGDGTFSVTALLDEAVVAPDEVAAEIAGKFDEITDAGVEVAAKPGLFYSVEQGASLGAMTEGDRVMATGDTVTIPATKFEGAGFYKVLVNTTAKDIVE